MDESSKEEMGLTTDALARSFEGIFRQAKPISSFAFLNPDPQKYEIVTGIVFYPLNASEVEAFDHMLDDSAATMLRFSQSFGGQAQPYPQMIKAGDRSLAWTFSSTSGQLTFKGEMIVLRQTDAVALLMTLNLADQKPALTVANLAPSFADYLKQALKP